MVEGARLESVYTVKNGIEGSNPSFSALLLWFALVNYNESGQRIQASTMKKLLAISSVFGMLCFGSYASNDTSSAAKPAAATQQTETVVSVNDSTEVMTAEDDYETEDAGIHQAIKQKFIEGGAGFMGIVVLCLILGLALAIERIIYLNMATTNTDKLLDKLEKALDEGGVEAAMEICRNTRGPVASIFYQGLSRHAEGLEMVEKSVVSYGSVQMGLLEKGLPWIALFIALAPMLGFLGTVVGMIVAFDAIEVAGDISPTLVANGIKIALITTVGGLIVAMILQVFYNYLLTKIERLVISMANAAISLIDILAKLKRTK